MGTTKLVDVVWVEIISMEIVHTAMLTILNSLIQVLPIGMLPFLPAIKNILHNNGSDE